MSVYAVIIPTETRDYWIDKANGVTTMTVWLGLVKASVLAIVLLIAGGALMVTAFVLTVAFSFPLLLVSVSAILVADAVILQGYKKLYMLSKEYSITRDTGVGEKIVELSSRNPKWINLAQQSIVIIALALIVARFLPFVFS